MLFRIGRANCPEGLAAVVMDDGRR